MDQALTTALVAAGAAVLAALVAALAVTLAGRRRLRSELAASRSDLADLRRLVEDLSRRVGDDPVAPQPVPVPREYLITDLTPGTAGGTGLEVPQPPADHLVSGREFASLAVGESLVRVLSLGYGVRRALSPEHRHRIRFEVRREVKRARRERRREVKAARRLLRAAEPGDQDPQLAARTGRTLTGDAA